MGLDPAATTPAHEKKDGVDFVPTKPFYLFGQHFAAIAAAGPIAGPIIAVQEWGWLPCLLWIGLGVVLIGAVHDFMALAASVRHGARSIADITREHLGPKAGVAMMAFIWLALVYVIVAFADITSSSFVTGTRGAGGAATAFHPGGAVAAASIFYLAAGGDHGIRAAVSAIRRSGCSRSSSFRRRSRRSGSGRSSRRSSSSTRSGGRC